MSYKAIEDALSDTDGLFEMKRRGHNKAREFTSEKSAESVISIFKERVPRRSYNFATKATNANGQSKEEPSTIIIYTGPISTEPSLYDRNFNFSLKHGLPCSYHSYPHESNVHVYFVLTSATKAKYESIIDAANNAKEPSLCRGNLHIIVRENRCDDEEPTTITILSEERIYVGPSDKVFLMSSVLLGPLLPMPRVAVDLKEPYWASTFTNLINDGVKLVGLTSCEDATSGRPFVQSVLLTTDRVGLGAMLYEEGDYSFFSNDCGEDHREEVISDYELKLSEAIMLSGYTISALNNPRLCQDTWSPDADIHNDASSITNQVFWKGSTPPREAEQHAKRVDSMKWWVGDGVDLF